MKGRMKRIEYPKSRLYNMLLSSLFGYTGVFVLLNVSRENGWAWGWILVAGGFIGILFNGFKLYKRESKD